MSGHSPGRGLEDGVRNSLLSWLDPDTTFEEDGLDEENHVRLILAVGIPMILVLADACFFYTALQQFGWDDGGFSFPALLASIAYLGVLVFVCYQSIILRHRVVTLKKEWRDVNLNPKIGSMWMSQGPAS